MIINTNFDFQAEANGRAQSDTQPHKLAYNQDRVALDWYRGDKDSDIMIVLLLNMNLVRRL